MSMNIVAIETIYESGFGFGDTYNTLAAKYTRRPAVSVLDDDWDVTQPFAWCGERSGSTFDTLLEVLASFNGSIDLLLVWEDGTVDGLRLRDHKVTQHYVLVSIGDEIV